jgi:hypothetical protein
MSETANQTIPNRRQRRAAMKYQGILKMKGKLPFKEWLEICKQTREKGKEIHEANVEAAEKSIYAKLEQVENNKIAYWKEEGYTDKEIDKLRDALALITIKDKSTWHKDKKEARKTFKELREKLNLRKS